MRKGRAIKAINLRKDLNTILIFEGGQNEAARELGLCQASIWAVLNNKSTNASGYYFWYADTPIPIDVKTYRYRIFGKKIEATDLYDGKKYIFDSCTQAAIELSMSVSSVSHVLRGYYPTACGYTFKYIEEDL